MKYYLRISILFIAITFLKLPVKAQETNKRPSQKSIPGKGYWVIEGNIHSPKTNTFYCYNNEDSLIYTEKIVGIKFNTKRRTTLKKLNKMLNNSLLTADKINTATENGSLVKAILNVKKY